MKILLDENVSNDLPLLEKQLRERGYDLKSMSHIAPSTLDPDVLQIANKEGRTIITQDSDFSAHKFRDNLSMPYGVIFLDIGKYSHYYSVRQDSVFSRKLASVIDTLAKEEYDLCDTVITITQTSNGTMSIRPKKYKNKKEVVTGYFYMEEDSLELSDSLSITAIVSGSDGNEKQD